MNFCKKQKRTPAGALPTINLYYRLTAKSKQGLELYGNSMMFQYFSLHEDA